MSNSSRASPLTFRRGPWQLGAFTRRGSRRNFYPRTTRGEGHHLPKIISDPSRAREISAPRTKPIQPTEAKLDPKNYIQQIANSKYCRSDE